MPPTVALDAEKKPQRTVRDDASRLRRGPAEAVCGGADVRSAGSQREDEIDHERSPESSETSVRVATVRLALRRLARS